MPEETDWIGYIEVSLPDPVGAERLSRALGPEASREVPRARAELERPAPATVRLALRARDTGSLRAATNTYLGWIDLALRTASLAETRAA